MTQLEPKPYADFSRGPGGIIFKGSLHEEEKHKLDKEMPGCWRGRASNKSVSEVFLQPSLSGRSQGLKIKSERVV